MGALNRAAAFALLAWRLLGATISSGWQTVVVILRPRAGATAGFVDYSFSPMGATATTVLACLVCLTPGTTAVEVEPAAGHIRLHMLDAARRETALREIRERFEPLVRQVFAEERQP